MPPSAKWSFNQKFWDHLTAIRIDRTVVSTCLTLLRSCPSHLESFRCINPTISLSGHTFRLPLRIPSRLAQFEWTGGLGSLDEYFWQNVKLPVVCDLTWNLLEPLKESQTQIRREFFRQLSNVQKMKMEFYSGINELRDVWRSLDKLQELHLDACRLQKQGGPDIMDALTLCHDCGHQNVLPNLRVLEIEILIGSSSTITRMLRSRRDSPLLREGQMALGFDVDQGPIRLERSVLHMEQLDWEQGDREKLNVLVAAGLLLDIYVGDDHLSSF
ncbi:hypothetical protein NP233_g12397 [Leucocoprinus birnbaumii]|uniref:Uncharacterized protein n=1 Tax=Leucocoprinus birnbaumii TaxID=56174 RepID=A0AAD5VIL0_9AGAR|nr:hypothetical protein NP233_g12397 [Leucocoprinus birnbaumii]